MKIKNILLAAALVVAAALPASAQNFFLIRDGSTGAANTVAANSTSNYTTYINTARIRLVGVEQRFKLMSSGTSDTIIHADGSLDGASFSNDSLGTYTNAATGTTLQTNRISFDCGANIAVRIRMENANSAALTNLYLAGTTKASVGGTVTGGTFTGTTLAGSTTNSDLTASLPVFTDANKVFVSKTVANTKTLFGIQSGTCKTVTDGTVTNTFGTAFSSAPIVVATQSGTTLSTNSVIVSVTTTGFVLKSGVSGVTNQWVAIGAP